MKKFIRVALTTTALLAVFIFTSCEKNEKGKATVQLMLTDAPALYDQVNIDIQEVQLHNGTEGWVTLALEHPGVYNLLEFSNGLDTLLGSCEMPAGDLSQIRLVLGDDNTIVVDGVSYPITIPSSSTSGLKFNVHADLEAGLTYRFWLDFDAAHSIHQTGNGKYMLKPVIRMFAEATSGAIDGNIFPGEALPIVKMYNSTDTLMALPIPEGYFMIRGVPAGTYTVEFSSGDSTSLYVTQKINDVAIVNGQITRLDPITLLLP